MLSEGENHRFAKKNKLKLYTNHRFAFLLSVHLADLEVTLIDGCTQLFIIGKPLILDLEEIIELSCEEGKRSSVKLDVSKYCTISICCGKYFSIVLEKNYDSD